MRFKLNGSDENYDGHPELSLLKFLHKRGLTAAKNGCSQGTCGCCTVQLNARAVYSCVTPMKNVENGEVVTLEGLPLHIREAFAEAFAKEGGTQCGFCTPGMVMRAMVLLGQNPDPTRDEVVKTLSLNLCRCTGYKKIVDSVLYAAKAIRENKKITPQKQSGRVGTSLPKYHARELILGEHRYSADIEFPGMLYGALKFSEHPRAKVLSIDTSAAERLAGVKKIFTAADIPGARHTGLIVSDWPLMIEVGEVTRYIGDVIAGVAAENEEIAREAVELICVRYEVLLPVTDVAKALNPNSPKVHKRGNLLSLTSIKRGDLNEALANSEYVVDGTYHTQFIEHAFLEPECCVSRPLEDGIEVFSQGQGVFDDRKQIADILGLPQNKVKVVLVPSGGGFGGKEDLTVQGHAALFACQLKKPVKVRLTREESICMHPKRHPFSMDYKLGCTKNGRLTALKARIIGDTGAYASVGMKVLERGAGFASGAYNVPVVDIESKAVYTNNIPCGAMRGFGVNQVTFAMESCIDELCEKGGFDRWQFRYDNAIVDGSVTATGQVIKSGAGVRATLLAVKDRFLNGNCAGIACGIKNTGLGNGAVDLAKVSIEIAKDKVIIYHGWTEMGQGVNTVAVHTLCQETGIDPEIVEVKVNTAKETTGGMTTASRGTSLLGNALLNACAKLKSDLQDNTLANLSGKVYRGEWKCDWTNGPQEKTDEMCSHYSYGYATQVVVLNETGKVAKVYAAHDAGKIYNPKLFEGQIEGAVHMGLGYALSEELIMENGAPKSTKLRHCGILRAKDMPPVEVIGVEVPDPYGPYGAKGVGEIGLVPTAAAVANALYRFDGVRRYRLPLSLKRSSQSGQ